MGRGRGRVTTEAEIGATHPPAKNSRGHPKRPGERPGTDLPSEPP